MIMPRNWIDSRMPKALDRDELQVMRVERAADPGEEGREAEGQGAVAGEVDPHHLRREVVVAHRHKRPSVAGAHQVGGEHEGQHQIGQHHVEVAVVGVESEAEDREGVRAVPATPPVNQFARAKKSWRMYCAASVAMAR